MMVFCLSKRFKMLKGELSTYASWLSLHWLTKKLQAAIWNETTQRVQTKIRLFRDDDACITMVYKKQAMKSKPGSITPLWPVSVSAYPPLLWVPAVTSLRDGVTWETYSSPSCLWSWCLITVIEMLRQEATLESRNWDRTWRRSWLTLTDNAK